MTIPTDKLLDLIFSQNGLLSRSLKNYEERTGQMEMARHVLEAYTSERVALIEAGTGIGKSLAYLVPAIYWALKHQEKTVIATNTIALQEQLIHKDIPFLLKTMDLEVKACLVKGMGNYLCLRKLAELQKQPLLFSHEETKEVQSIERWSERTKEGSRSDLPFPVAPSTWEKVAAEGESCNHVHCPEYKNCFFFKARKQAEEAQVLVVNHHLLLADIQKRRRSPDQESILPSYSRLVVDEAHNLEEIALESFAQRLDRIAMQRLFARIYSEAHPERSRLHTLRKDLASLPSLSATLINKLEVEIPAQKRKCQAELEEAFSKLSFFFDIVKDCKKRIHEAMTDTPSWKETIIPALMTLSEEIERLSLSLQGVAAELEIYKEKISSHLLELQAIAMRLDEAASFLQNFVNDEPREKRVRWFEASGSNMAITDAALDISAFLSEHLFSSQRTSVLCSATMATARSFHFVKQRLGLMEKSSQEAIFDSPFNYIERALFLVPTDMPIPSSPDFLSACNNAMAEIIEASRGSVFLLFTSYEMLQSCHRALSQTPLPHRYPFLRQGDLPRNQLLEQFKKREGSVLFATDSFWEGVDVPGEALRCVVIAKLPFSVPSDPLYEAYSQSLEKEGLDPFMDYSVPQAVIKFKQGFGRLMRKNDDRGCVVCLDPRIVKKNYGKQFVQSLPPCRTYFASTKDVLEEMKLFYERTKI